MQKLIGQTHVVVGAFPQACTSITGDFISLKNYAGVSIIISLDVHTGTDTGAITLEQAKDVSDSGSVSKTLGFDFIWLNADTEAAEALTKTAVTSDSVTTAAATKSQLYIIEVKSEDLDVANDFDCLQVLVGTVATSNVSIVYVLHTPRYRDQVPANITSITD